MAQIKTTTIPEQAAAHLREGIASGRLVSEMPGRDQLAADLGISPSSMQQALALLVKEGLLVLQGQGRRSLIRLPEKGLAPRRLRVGILDYDNCWSDYMNELRHQLEEAGHISVTSQKGLQELGMNVKRVARVVREINADAWVVFTGSREILQWFVENDIKVFALAGRRFGLPIAGTGPDKASGYAQVVRRLVALGHERIVLLCGRHLRQPVPSKFNRAFLDAMKDAGLVVGDYNLPDWDSGPEGLQKILDSLFKTTPPTALLLDEIHVFHATYHFLAQRQLKVPQDVSLVSTDGSEGFAWCKPTVAHISWDYRPVLRRIMRWVNNVARGIDDRRQNSTKAEFIDGGTIGPAPDRQETGN
jgi:DNA-binding LacI/PurR family transcriptional regulator